MNKNRLEALDDERSGGEGSAADYIKKAKKGAELGGANLGEYLNEKDPLEALKLAEQIEHSGSLNRRLQVLAFNFLCENPWREEATPKILEAAIKGAIAESASEEELIQNLELIDVVVDDIVTCKADDKTGREARDLVMALGGAVMEDGTLVMMLASRGDGETFRI